ncbi:MAG: hypothetical protein ABUT20_62145 [Bacteroidota bacterium]
MNATLRKQILDKLFDTLTEKVQEYNNLHKDAIFEQKKKIRLEIMEIQKQIAEQKNNWDGHNQGRHGY